MGVRTPVGRRKKRQKTGSGGMLERGDGGWVFVLNAQRALKVSSEFCARGAHPGKEPWAPISASPSSTRRQKTVRPVGILCPTGRKQARMSVLAIATNGDRLSFEQQTNELHLLCHLVSVTPGEPDAPCSSFPSRSESQAVPSLLTRALLVGQEPTS